MAKKKATKKKNGERQAAKKKAAKKKTTRFSPNDRTKKGRFTQGNPGGPGRPKQPKKKEDQATEKENILHNALKWAEERLGL